MTKVRLISLMRYLCLFFIITTTTAQEIKYQSLLLDHTLTVNANSVVRLNEMTIELRSKKSMLVKNKTVVTVLNSKGIPHARTVLGYDDSKKVKALEVLIYDATGQQIEKIKKKDFKDVSAADGFSLYLDYRLLYYKYTPTNYPYTLEFNYEYESTDTGIIPYWYFLKNFSSSVQKSKYTVIFETPELKPIIHEKHLENIIFEKNETTNSIVYTANTIAALKKETMIPSLNSMAPVLMTRIKNFHYKGYEGAVDNWKELGLWIDRQLLSGRDALNAETIAKAKSLVAGIDDDLEKAKIIYKYVQDNTRYVSVQIGIGGFQPISAIEVDRVKYGDCKGLSNYTMALLKAVGVVSYYAVVQAGSEKVDFDENFADLAQGNHAILAIPYNDTYYWIDCTSQILPFGYIGTFTDDRKVLIVKPDGGEIVTTKAYTNKDNYQHIKATYTLASDGSIAGKAELKTKGTQYYHHFRLSEESKEDVVKHYKEQWHNINNLNVAEYKLEDDKEQVIFSESVLLNATNYASISGDRLLFSANAFNNSSYVPKRYRNRKLPFEIQRGFLDEDEFIIQLPSDYKIEAIPSERKIETAFGAYQVSFEKDATANAIVYKRSLYVKKGRYNKEQYAAYRDFRKETAKIDGAQVVLVKK